MGKPSQLHWEHLPDACISTLTWALVAIVVSFGLLRHRTLVYSNRVVSLLHALVALPLCISAARYWYPLPYFGQQTTAPEASEPSSTPILLLRASLTLSTGLLLMCHCLLHILNRI